MTDPVITYHDTPTKGRYAATIEGIAGEGELPLSKVSPTLIIADHTAVPDALRGTGAGRRLVERAVADARAEGRKIVPLCPFTKAQIDRTPEWQDVLQGR